MSEKKTNRILYISILSVFAFGNCMGAVDGALSKIACALNVDHTIALYVGSIPALTSMISGLILGVTAGKKLPYKAAAVFCAVLMIAAGTIPVIMQNFAMLLIARCFFGLGLGGIMSLQNPIAARLIPLQNRAAILGLGTCTAFTFQCILQLVGGILADIHWNLVFLTHMILIIPLVGLLFLLPEMQTESFQEKREERKRLPLTAVMMCVVIGIVTLNLAPLFIGAAVFVILAVILLVKSPLPKEGAKAQTI